MTKYIGKKIIVSLAVLLAAGFVLYMVVCSISDPLACYILEQEAVVLRGDTLYRYRIDHNVDCFSPLYFVPVNVGFAIDGGDIELPDSDHTSIREDFDGKYYTPPFSYEHIIERRGLSYIAYTLHSTEKLS